jgi:hypothetical protein
VVDSTNELNKRKVRLFVEAVWNEGRLDLIEELVADDYIGRVTRMESAIHGPEGVRELVSCGRRGHPDLYIKIDDQIAEDDRVATRWRATAGGTHCYEGISVIRLLAGKQVDSHTEYTTIPRSAPSKPAGDVETSFGRMA